jgi:hypothetical protein
MLQIAAVLHSTATAADEKLANAQTRWTPLLLLLLLLLQADTY